MKHLTYLFLFSFLFFLGCEEESTTGTGDNTAITTITGKLENWTHGAGKTIKIGNYITQTEYQIVGSGAIAADGSFAIALLTPPESYLNYIQSPDSGAPAGITSSDRNARVYGAGGFMIFDGSNFFAFVLCMNRDFRADTFWVPTVNDQIYQPTYFTARTTLNGSETEEEDWDPRATTPTYITRVVNNVTVAAGWNNVIGTVTAKTTNTVTFNMTLAAPTNLKWYYQRVN
ncbi:MAG: hypothetical protein HUU54_01875 [Ignavibacteriaceae bacterium]|nr:hypothetical protein [Ignavibacteriaceae bacterium]